MVVQALDVAGVALVRAVRFAGGRAGCPSEARFRPREVLPVAADSVTPAMASWLGADATGCGGIWIASVLN